METAAPARLVAAHRRQLDRIRNRTIAAAEAAWRTGDIDAVVRLILSGQSMVVTATDAGLSFMAGTVAGGTTQPLGIDPDRIIGAKARGGTVLEEVYSRPDVVRRAEGAERARTYLRSQVEFDMQAAYRSGAYLFVNADTTVTGYQRVLSPGENCGLCIAASTQRYHVADLHAIHPGCRCQVAPIFGTTSRVIDQQRLDAVYRESDGRTDFGTLRQVQLDESQLPSNLDPAAIRGLNARVERHPEYGAFLTGDSHATAFQN